MNQTKKNLFIVAGVIMGLIGVLFSILSFTKENYWATGLFAAILVTGLVFIAIGFGD